jgi:outer membrane protein assembly factor BamE
VPETPAATKPAATREDPFSFRMDRNLDAKNIETAPIEAAPSAKPKKVNVPPPAPEEEPGYFEKMLEKIGF